MMSLLIVLFFVVCAVASFIFALAESALFSLGLWQLHRLQQSQPESAEKLSKLLSRPEDVLATIVLGNTLVNSFIAAMGVWLILNGDWPPIPTLCGLFFLVLVVCEVAPKTIAVRSPAIWATRLAPCMLSLTKATRYFRQIVQFFNGRILRFFLSKVARARKEVSDEDYQELLELACQQGTLAKSEKEIILQIINLDRRTVREVMKPRSQMACISDDMPVEEMIIAARKLRHRRLPIYDEDADTIVGILNTRTILLNPEVDLVEAIEFPSFVPDSMNLLQLLKSLQKQQRGLAIVLDEFGGTAGLVSVEDILEAVVGEIRSEGEETGFVMQQIGNGKWRINGTMRQEDFRREYPPLEVRDEVDTMGGLLVHQLGVVPSAGQYAIYCGLRLTATAVDDRRVKELVVETIKRTEKAARHES
jgi:CBS domain containing-hemolysin-like protein